MKKTTRFSGAIWADQIMNIIIIGAGGIGSWTALNLSRIGHSIVIVDGDCVDDTNISGGQMFRLEDNGSFKSNAVRAICREFGCDNNIHTVFDYWDYGTFDFSDLNVVICAVDNMATRRKAFEYWVKTGDEDSLFIDGRLTMEMYEIFAIQKQNLSQIAEYEKNHLFSDDEATPLDCTTKQSTFAAMGIASNITATICNWASNRKEKMVLRSVPFYTRHFLPIFENKVENADVLVYGDKNIIELIN